MIGLTEDGLNGLSPASRAALDGADIVFGGPRHLELAAVGARGRPWPVPFSIAPVLALRGQRVAVLASGDPFWFGAGGVLAGALAAGEWRCFPAPSVASLIAAELGWRLEAVACHGLHAAPFTRLLPDLRQGARLIVLLRDGAAVADLAAWLVARGWGASRLSVAERMGGRRQRIRQVRAGDYAFTDVAAPVAVAVEAAGGVARPMGFGLPDDAFAHRGQITKRPVRALTLSALAPFAGGVLWDLGAGSGSVSVEWALAGGRAVAVETRDDRCDLVRANIDRFGLDGAVTLVQGDSRAVLADLPAPDAVFIGGGADATLVDAVRARLSPGGRLVINAVTLETEAMLVAAQAAHGGDLMRIEVAQAAPLGRMRGWSPLRPVVQWVWVA